MRRVIAIILAALLLLPTIYSAMDTEQALAASGSAKKVINALHIMDTEQGEIKTSATKITRAQFAQLLVNLSDQKDLIAGSSNVSLFKDVTKKHWAASYIRTAVNKGWMSGYLNGTFKPNQGVTLIEAVTGVLNLLGYTDSYFSGNLTQSKLAYYTSKKLNANISVKKPTSYLNYDDCVNLFYNTLKASNKDGKVYASVLGYSLDASGEPDYLSIVNTSTEGPIIAVDNWTSELPFSVDTATYYKNDVKGTYTDIDQYDVLYYSENFKTVWAYDSKVTGIISAISPDLVNPTSVTVAGVTYSFETSAASLDFASLGTFEKGDVVTLLLGKSGKIAGALSIDEYNATIVGLVLSVGTHLVLNESGSLVSSSYVTFVDATGNKYTQDYNATVITFSEEDFIKIKYSSGSATVSKYNPYETSLGNSTVNSDGTSLGSMKLAPEVNILDYYGGAYTTVYPARLANAIIMDRNILYYDTNVDGEITDLILYNVTGDIDSYGIFTGYTYAGSTGAYNYILNGTTTKLTKSSYVDFCSTEGPVGFKSEAGSIASSYALTKLLVNGVGISSVTSGSTKYPVAEKVSVYVYSDHSYSLTSLDKINITDYKVTAYMDKALTLGGRVRVIIAVPIN